MKKYDFLLHPFDVYILDLVFVLKLSCILHEEVSIVAVDFPQAQKVQFFTDFVEGEIKLDLWPLMT